jgi:transposase
MHSFHLGVDVAKAKLDCAVRTPDGKYKHKIFDNNKKGFAALVEWLDKHAGPDTHVCMEATGVYWEGVAEHLANLQYTVSVLNPFQIKSFGASRLTRTKTDKVDAKLIADFCKERGPEAWRAPSPTEQALRAMVLRLDSLQAMRTQESNRLDVARDIVKADIANHITWLEAEIKLLEKKIRDYIGNDTDMKDRRELLDSIPGLGERTIAMLLAFSVHSGKFDNARQATAFAGLDPRQCESGTSLKEKPRMSKIGHSFFRKAMYMPAMVTLYRTAWGKQFRARLAAAGKPPMLIIGAMMRKLIHVAFGVLKSGEKFNPALHGA